MADEQVRELELLLQLREQVQHLCPDRYVQCRHRLVEHENLRVQHQRSRDRDPLPLAAGEHVRIAVIELRSQADLRHHRAGGRGAVGGAHAGVDEQRLLQRLADLLARVERAVRVLEHDLHLAAQGIAGSGAGRGEVLAIDDEGARGRLFDQGDQAREGRLAGAGFADHRERLAGLERERHVDQRLDRGWRREQAAADLVGAA